MPATTPSPGRLPHSTMGISSPKAYASSKGSCPTQLTHSCPG